MAPTNQKIIIDYNISDNVAEENASWNHDKNAWTSNVWL